MSYFSLGLKEVPLQVMMYNITTSRSRTKRQSEVWEHVKRRIMLYPHAMASAITKNLHRANFQKTHRDRVNGSKIVVLVY